MSLCPHCQQPLPDPPESFCPSCGAAQGLARATWRPAGGSTPWEERDRLGFVGAFVETTKQVLMTPTSFFQRMPVLGGIPSPLLYGVIAGYLALVVNALYGAVLQAVFASTLAGLGNREGAAPLLGMLQGGLGLVIQIVLGPINVIIGLFLMSAIYHLLLLLFGGARGGFEATFRVVCYGHAGHLLSVIPVCGFLAIVYVLVLYVIGLSEAHGISRGKAAIVVLVPILLVCCCCILAFGVFFGSLATLLGHLQR
jgi:hypothetical protein